MGELTNYIDIAKRVIQIENDNSTNPEFSPIFTFPFTNDYKNWVNLHANEFQSTAKKKWVRFYSEIIDNQIVPSGVKIPVEWHRNIVNNRINYRIGYRTYGTYLIADINEKLLYIGKCEYPPIIRLLDRMIPRSFNQLNNVPQIWDNYISQGIKVKCAYCYNLSFDPEILESFLIHEYCIQEGTYQMFNRKMSTGEYYKKVLEIKSKLK
jgi:hypothetical protein